MNGEKPRQPLPEDDWTDVEREEAELMHKIHHWDGSKMINGKWETREVQIDGKTLSAHDSQKLRNHSPDGFAWGYGGSGPSQLALAILLHFTSSLFALEHYQNFKWEVIANLPQTDFKLEESVVHNWIFNALAANQSDRLSEENY